MPKQQDKREINRDRIAVGIVLVAIILMAILLT